jgi:hypothetical protein
VYSIAIHIKNYLPHRSFKFNKLLYEIMFGNKLLIKYLYSFGCKCNIHIHEKKQIGMSELSLRKIKCFIGGSTESSKILQLYNPQQPPVFTSRDVVFPESTHHLESTKIESPTDLSLDLDSDAS